MGKWVTNGELDYRAGGKRLTCEGGSQWRDLRGRAR